ncbi:MAG: hypothetical protein GXP50_12070 [Deltaproteobacteria bacterium]|nr:hypothetical protein [Deltaproteobacteria bacterium]
MDKPYPLNVRFLRRVLIAADDLAHFAVALVLLVCAGVVLVRAVLHLGDPSLASVLEVLNDLLLALIIMELLWPVVRFLKREPFSLNPFLYVGIISSTRRILLIEAETSLVSRAHEGAWSSLWPPLVEIGANVAVILVLAVALRVVSSPRPSSPGPA